MNRTLYTLGLLLLALGGWLYYDSLPPPVCTFNHEEQELNNLNPNSEHELLFTLTNPTTELGRIVGLADC